MFCCSSFLFSYVLYTNIISCSLFSARCALYILYVCGMALRRPCFPAALPHGFSACGVLRPFRRHILAVGLFRPRFRLFRPLCCVLLLRTDAPRLMLFLLLPSDISAEIVAAFFGGRPLPLQRTVFRCFPKGRLLTCKRWSFAARKDTFCTLKGHLLESCFSAPLASPHGSRRGRAEPCLGRGTRRA